MLETFGSIIKEEQVVTIESGILPNTFVLENLGSFPGYYGANMAPHDKPDTIFLVTRKRYPTEDIFRITHEIRKRTGIMFDGSSASININNNEYSAIRLRHLAGFENIVEIQRYFIEAGITFAKLKRIEGIAVIQIKKIFKVHSVVEKILKDEDEDMYYLKIDRQFSWTYFRSITTQVRNNISLPAFDAALAVIYGSEVLDLIRIYSTSLTVEELQKLHAKYVEIIKKSF